MRSSVSRVMPELPVVFTPSGTSSQRGTVVSFMSMPAGTSHCGSVHREHTTSQRQVSESCLVKAVTSRGEAVVCLLFGFKKLTRHMSHEIIPLVFIDRQRRDIFLETVKA